MDSAIEFARTAADYVSLNPWWDNSMQPYTMAYTLAALAVFHVLLSVVFGRSKGSVLEDAIALRTGVVL